MIILEIFISVYVIITNKQVYHISPVALIPYVSYISIYKNIVVSKLILSLNKERPPLKNIFV